jgi:flagellar biosynthesis/type III secretory pathway protein FliH
LGAKTRINWLSKLIKPDDGKAFQSARKFRKEHFPLTREPSPKEDLYPDFGLKVNPTSGHSNPEALAGAVRNVIEDAEEKAEQIVREAQTRADDILRQARERGRADGVEEGREKIETQRRASAELISSFIEQVKERQAELVQSLAPGLAALAAELAQKIIHREVNKDSSLAMKQAEQAIAKLLKREKLIIRVNGADEELMKEHKPALQRMFDGIDKIDIISDPEVERGGCIVETDLIKVDAQPGSQLRAASRTILDGEEK